MVRAERIAPSLPSPKQTLAEPTNAWQTILFGGGVPDFRERCTQYRKLSADTPAPDISRLAGPDRASISSSPTQ